MRLPCLLPLFALFLPLLHPAHAQQTSLWQAIRQNASFSILSQCVEQADPAVLALLDSAADPLTLFAPLDAAFGTDDASAVCPDGDTDTATALVGFLLSNTTTPLPYLNQPFALPLVEARVPVANVYVYAISKDASTPASLAPILYVNDAPALGWEALNNSCYLVPLAKPLTAPPGNDGSLWDVLEAHGEFSTTVGLIAAQLPEFQALLQAPPDVLMHKGYHTLFVPDDAAWAKLPADRLARLQTDAQALQTLLRFHTLSNPQGADYPRSTTGMYYAQQFYPTTSLQACDIYVAFYGALSTFTGLRLPNDLGIFLDLSRVDGTLRLQGNGTAVTTPDLSAYNGVVHGLDGVLPLPEAIPDVLAAPPSPLAAAGDFTVLAQLVQAAVADPAGAPELASGGPFTFLAPTDAAFAEAFASGRLPRLPVLLQDTATVASLCRYWALDSSAQLFLFSPDPYTNPFQDDFPDQARLLDGQGRAVFVHRQTLESMSLASKLNDTAVFVNGARLYQCTEGSGWGHDCGAHPTPSNTYAINDAHVVNIVHALDAVPLPPPGTLLQVLQADPDLSSFVNLLLSSSGSSVVARLDSSTSDALFTVFAPTNDALAALQAARPWLLESLEAIQETLSYHVVPALWYARWLSSAQPLATLAFDGEALVLVNASTDAVHVNRLTALETDLPASNGVVHKLGGVLVPDLLQIAYASGSLQRTVAAVEASDDLLETLAGPGPFTLFGPLDALYETAADLTPDQLQYHVGAGVARPEDVRSEQSTVVLDSLLGLPLYLAFLNATVAHPYVASQSGMYVNQAEMQLPVLRAVNGLVYAVDAFLQPPQESIMALLRGREDGRGFATLLTQTGLHTQLEGGRNDGPWTVFVPTTHVLEQLYLKERIWADAVQAPQILAFHMVRGRRLFTPAFANVTTCRRTAEDYCWGPPDVVSLQGQPLGLQVVSKEVTFMSTVHSAFTAPVALPDLHASNGVVHFLDGILTFDGYQRPR